MFLNKKDLFSKEKVVMLKKLVEGRRKSWEKDVECRKYGVLQKKRKQTKVNKSKREHGREVTKYSFGVRRESKG